MLHNWELQYSLKYIREKIIWLDGVSWNFQSGNFLIWLILQIFVLISNSVHKFHPYTTRIIEKTMGLRFLIFLGGVCFIFIIFQVSRTDSTTADDSCIPLSQCSEMMLLLQKKHNGQLSDRTRVDVFNYLRSITCGYKRSEALVKCPPDFSKIQPRFGPPN